MNAIFLCLLYTCIFVAVILFVAVLPYLTYQSKTRRLKRQQAYQQEQLKKIYAKIPPSTMVTLTKTERGFHKFIVVIGIMVWCFGMVFCATTFFLNSYAFVTHKTEAVPVTIVNAKHVNTNYNRHRHSLHFYELLLSAEVNGTTVQDTWAIIGEWYVPHQGDVVDGLMYKNGDHIELGIHDAVYPLFHWTQILGMIVLTLITGFAMKKEWEMLASKTIPFEKLSLDYKQARYRQALKK